MKLENTDFMVNVSEPVLLRRAFFRKIFGALEQRGNIAISGLPLVGKTWLIEHLLISEVQQWYERKSGQSLTRYIFVQFEVGAYLTLSFEDFIEALRQEFIRQSRDYLNLSDNAGTGANGFSNMLEEISRKNFYPVILMDMFDEIAGNKEAYAILNFLRAQSTLHRVSYVTFSNASLEDICKQVIMSEEVMSSFYRIFAQEYLGVITKEEARSFTGFFVKNFYQRLGMKVDEKQIDTDIEMILRYTGRNPCFIYFSCMVLSDEKLQSNNVEEHFKRVAYKLLKPKFSDIWDRLTKEDKKVIQDKALGWKYTTGDTIPIEYEQEERQLRLALISSAFFRQFVRDINKIGLFKMTAEELEQALEKMYDLAELGETNLRLMKAVGYRLNGNSSSTSVERGKVIQGVLREALEQLRGTTTRNDESPDWLYYNILEYRYFTRYRLKHREIAARLEFSYDRQYYRKRNAALIALLNILFEMEELN